MARELTLTTPLGSDVLYIAELRGEEALGRLFQFDLVVHSADENIAIDALLGQRATAALLTRSGSTRYFDGYISRFALTGRTEGGYATYEIRLSPWLWLFTRSADCKIFQAMTTPDIVKAVLGEAGFTDYEDALTGQYPVREYCVQYRETDFEFISRLLEHEGIYYFFKHSNGKHTLVLADAYSAHGPIPGPSELPYHPPGLAATVDEEHVSNWRFAANLQPGSVALGDFNFTMPQNRLRTQRLVPRGHAQAEYEIFDYPGLYQDAGAGENTALHRIEELQAQFEQLQAESDAREIHVGGLFKLANHPRADQNREYLLTTARYHITTSELASEASSEPLVYHCDLGAIDAKTPFRAARTTRKPVVYGPHTATVVGPAGEEIYTDEYARVKVQFHWDRYGGDDQNSSCWVRVSQYWAGPGMGSIHIPRIGQEVVVEFAEGDPDRPIITGRLYNADNRPPYDLPANKTQSGIKSRSSPGGGASNCNEIRMEDKTGSEELYIQAEKNQNILVKNDKGETVGHDETTSIGNDQTLSVGNNQSETIGNDQTVAVGNNQSLTVGVNQTASIGSDQSESVGANRTESVGINETLSVGANRSRTVGANESIKVGVNRSHIVGVNETIGIGAAQQIAVGGLQVIAVGAAQTITVGAAQSIDVGIAQSISVGAGQDISVGASRSLDVGANNSTTVSGNDSLKAGKNVVIDAGDSITLQCGAATITMKKNGEIVIKGKNITIKDAGKTTVNTTKDIVMKGKKILQN